MIKFVSYPEGLVYHTEDIQPEKVTKYETEEDKKFRRKIKKMIMRLEDINQPLDDEVIQKAQALISKAEKMEYTLINESLYDSEIESPRTRLPMFTSTKGKNYVQPTKYLFKSQAEKQKQLEKNRKITLTALNSLLTDMKSI